MTPEAKVKAAVKRLLQQLKNDGEPIWWFWPPNNGLGKSGVPDLILCWHGRLVGIELKAPGRLAQVTPLQQAQLEGIQAAGGTALAADTVQAVQSLLASIRSSH